MVGRYVGRPGAQKLKGWQQCIMPVTKTCMTPRIDANSGGMFGVKRRGERCKALVSPEKAAMLGAAVCQGHVPHYLASLKSSVEHDRARRAKLDPGCAVE